MFQVEAFVQQTCPCTSLQGPASICPNTPQTLVVVNPPAGAFVAFSVPSGSTGNIVTQSGFTAIVNQPGTYLATVCFPLTLTIPTGTNCGVNCNNPLVTASLSSNIAGNPPTVTICQTGPSPSSVTLTCNTNVGVNPATTTYRFFLNGALLVDSPSRTLTVGLGTFVGNSASFTCRAVTQSAQCVSAASNAITVVKCTAGAPCPSVVTLTQVGQCPNPSVRATINNPQPGVIYSFTLRRSASPAGPFVVINSQNVGPFATVPVGGISATFTGLPPGNAFYIVDVSAPNCPTISSNTINLPACCQPVGATLTSNQITSTPSLLTICTAPPGPATITLTCTASSSVSGATFRFTQNGVTVQESSSNTLTVGFADVQNISPASYACLVIQPGSCVGTPSNIIIISTCNLPPCNTPVRPRLIATTNLGRACVGQVSTLQCIPAACTNAGAACLAQFRYQLLRSSDGFIPGPTGTDFQASSFFTVVPLGGETFTCRVIRAQPCVGNAISPPSFNLNAVFCP